MRKPSYFVEGSMKEFPVHVSKEAEELVYFYEKEKWQQEYQWTDEQFNVFWNNPELNRYLERKNELLWIAQLGISNGSSVFP